MDSPQYNFLEDFCSKALAVENKIVYFGSEKEDATFVLEQSAEGELKVARKEGGLYSEKEE